MKIKEDQLKKIQEQQKTLNTLLNNVGYLEARKHSALHEIGKVNEEVEEFKQELEKTYGRVNIDLETGEYVMMPENEEELADV